MKNHRSAGRRSVATKAVAVLVAGATVVLAWTSISSAKPSTPARQDALGSSVKVGFDAALSGFLAPFDSLVTNGAKIAVDQINAAGGINGKTKINLVLKDHKSDAATVVTVAQDLIDGGAQVLLPGCNLDFQVALASVAQRKNIPVFSPCNADPRVGSQFSVYTGVGVGGNRQVAALATYMKSKGYKNIWVMNTNDNGYVKIITKYLLAAAKLYHFKVVGQDNYKLLGTDFSSNITKIQHASTKPDVIATGMFAPDIAVFTKQLRAAGVTTPVAGTDGCDTSVTLTTGGGAVNGLAFTTFAFPKPGTATAKLYSDYKKKFGKTPDSAYVALGYNAIKVLAASVGKAGSTDPKAIRKALSGLKVASPTGTITYPKTGTPNPQVDVALVTVKNGKFQLAKEINPTLVPAP
jgi:branched-chain amino acid transport system substrate-binding protein